MKDEARAYGRVGQARGASRLPHWGIEGPILTRALAPEPISRTSPRTGVLRLGGCIGGGQGGTGRGIRWPGAQHQNSRMKKKSRATSATRKARHNPAMAPRPWDGMPRRDENQSTRLASGSGSTTRMPWLRTLDAPSLPRPPRWIADCSAAANAPIDRYGLAGRLPGQAKRGALLAAGWLGAGQLRVESPGCLGCTAGRTLVFPRARYLYLSSDAAILPPC